MTRSAMSTSRATRGTAHKRNAQNFPISGMHAHPALIRATAMIKAASARANRKLGKLDGRLAGAIEQAALEIAGALGDQFVVDVFQAWRGNLAQHERQRSHCQPRQLLARRTRRVRPVHPNDHVNMSQSTNDTVPAAIRLASLLLAPRLISALADLLVRLRRRSRIRRDSEICAHTPAGCGAHPARPGIRRLELDHPPGPRTD